MSHLWFFGLSFIWVHSCRVLVDTRIFQSWWMYASHLSWYSLIRVSYIAPSSISSIKFQWSSSVTSFVKFCLFKKCTVFWVVTLCGLERAACFCLLFAWLDFQHWRWRCIFSEPSGCLWTTRCYNPEDCTLHSCSHGNLTSSILRLFLFFFGIRIHCYSGSHEEESFMYLKHGQNLLHIPLLCLMPYIIVKSNVLCHSCPTEV
jgi:hypothetical protein